jgi:uncharacterized protein YhaN
METLRAALNEARKLERRVEAMRADCEAFQSEAACLAAAVGLAAPAAEGLALAAELQRRLAQARAQSGGRRKLQEQIEEHTQAIAQAQAHLDAAEATLGEAKTAVGARTRLALAAALDAIAQRRARQRALGDVEAEIAALSQGTALTDLEQRLSAWGSIEEVRRRVLELQAALEAATEAAQAAKAEAALADQAFKALVGGEGAAADLAELEQARAEMEAQAELFILKKAQRVLLEHAVRLQGQRQRNPLLARAGEVFCTLTLGRYEHLAVDHEGPTPRLIAVNSEGGACGISAMSEGTQDQLFLALRLAAIEQAAAAGAPAPLFVDDLFVNFDDARARAGLQVLGEFARSAQVLFFTHHDHLRVLAAEVFSGDAPPMHDLGLSA